MIRTREYQQGYNVRDLISKISTPYKSAFNIGPPLMGLNTREKRTEIQLNESPQCINARIHRDYVEPRPGLTLISDAFDSTILYIREFPVSTGELYLIVITQKSIYYSSNLSAFTRIPWPYTEGTATTNGTTTVTGSGTMWASNVRAGDRFKIDSVGTYVTVASVDSNTQLTLTSAYPAASGSYTIDRYFGGSSDNIFWGQVIADVDYFVFSQGVDPVLYINSDFDIVRRLSADCPPSNLGIVYADRLIIGSIPGYPYRIQWCARGNYTDWTGTGSGYKDWVEDPYEITAFSIISGVCLVYKTYSINQMTETGKADSPFEFRTRVPGVGCIAGTLLASIGEADVFVGSDNIYLYDLRSLKSIGDKVKDSFFNFLNLSAIDSAHTLVAEEFNEVQFYFPTANVNAPKKALIYNYDMNIFTSMWEFSSEVNASGYATQKTTETWDTIQGTWETATESWDSVKYLASTPLNMVAQGNKLLKQDVDRFNDNEEPFTFIWETKDFVTEELKHIALYRVVVDYFAQTSGTIYFELTRDGGVSWVESRAVELDNSEPTRLRRAFFDYLTVSEVLGGRIRASGCRFQVVRIRVEAVGLGKVNPS